VRSFNRGDGHRRELSKIELADRSEGDTAEVGRDSCYLRNLLRRYQPTTVEILIESHNPRAILSQKEIAGIIKS
jgi:hypothetical protein